MANLFVKIFWKLYFYPVLEAFVKSYFVVFGIVDDNLVVGSLVGFILVVACPTQVYLKYPLQNIKLGRQNKKYINGVSTFTILFIF